MRSSHGDRTMEIFYIAEAWFLNRGGLFDQTIVMFYITKSWFLNHGGLYDRTMVAEPW